MKLFLPVPIDISELMLMSLWVRSFLSLISYWMLSIQSFLSCKMDDSLRKGCFCEDTEFFLPPPSFMLLISLLRFLLSSLKMPLGVLSWLAFCLENNTLDFLSVKLSVNAESLLPSILIFSISLIEERSVNAHEPSTMNEGSSRGASVYRCEAFFPESWSFESKSNFKSYLVIDKSSPLILVLRYVSSVVLYSSARLILSMKDYFILFIYFFISTSLRASWSI